MSAPPAIDTTADDDRLGAALRALPGAATAAGDPVGTLRALVDALRPPSGADAEPRMRQVVTALETDAAVRDAVRAAVIALFAGRRQVAFYAEAGLLRGDGFFTELARRVGHRLLPERADPHELTAALPQIFAERDDHVWIASVSRETALRFWRALRLGTPAEREALSERANDLLIALSLLATRAAAAGTRADVVRDTGAEDAARSPFLALPAEAARFAAAWHDGSAVEDEKQLLVLVDQCRELVRRRQRIASTEGTDMALAYALEYLEQSLRRIELVASLLGSRFAETPGDALLERWSVFFREVLRGESHRHGVRRFLSDTTSLLALRVTENASRTGEHYIAVDGADYRAMWRSAMGAGVIIGCMALVKILTSKLDLAPIGFALAFGMNYALGFMLVHLLHFTIATKQPAMTAATIAARISEGRGRLRDLERIADVIVQTIRSQLAAILGNVMVAFPVALAVGVIAVNRLGADAIGTEKAEHLLHELSPTHSLALFHAAIAGVCLFLSGLISGYVDNRAAYRDYRERVAALPWLRRLAGEARAERAGTFVHEHLGGLAGNFCFGLMLGSIGTVGSFLGLPLDIRHVAFAAANLGYAVVGSGFTVDGYAFLAALGGVAAIGLVNLVVSFVLALWVALRARDVKLQQPGRLLGVLWRRFLSEPKSFILPPPASRTAESSAPH